MSFSGSVVELVGDQVAFFLGQFSHVGSFGQVLPDQSVGVLARPPFPGMVRRGEVELRSTRLFQPRVAVELAAVVGGDRPHSPAMPPQQRSAIGDRGDRGQRLTIGDRRSGSALET